jgi:hypothetical protein
MCAHAANSQRPHELLGGADQFKDYGSVTAIHAP